MHFYSYDEWVAHDYYYLDNGQIYRGHSGILDLSDESNADKRYLTIRSCWSDPTFKSTYQGVPVINPKMDKINMIIGCLYKLTGNTNDNRSMRGCIQQLGYQRGSLTDSPHIYLDWLAHEYNKFEGLNKEVLTIDLDYYDSFDKMLIFQTIYDGAISFQEARSSLEFYLSDLLPRNPSYDYQKYNYEIDTTIYSNDSLMIVGAMLTFDHVSNRKYLIIDNVCKPVYGHVDMDNQYDWNLLWDAVSDDVVKDSIIRYNEIYG